MKRKLIRKGIALVLSLSLLMASCSVYAESSGNPPEPPTGSAQSGEAPQGTPPDGFGGGQGGEAPQGTPPDGFGGGQGGQPGGMGGGSSQPDSYTAVNTYAEDTELTGEAITSTGTDENAVLVTAGTTTISGGTVSRTSDSSTGGDNSSFYGVGAALLVTGGTLNVTGTDISTDSKGGAGVFAYGDGVANVSDCTITTEKDTSGGIHVAGGGTLYASDLTVVTQGESSAAIRSDRGGGTMVVNGGSYTANGTGSPAVYVTADITVSDAELTANGSEALCLEGKNNVTLNDCVLTGNMPENAQNDTTWTVILYQSMSGDSEVGHGTFTMNGGTLVSLNGGLFYTTNTSSEFTLTDVELQPCADCEYLLRCTGNSNQRGWGTSGSNGADCTFNAIQQEMAGNVIWDSISNLTLNLTEGSIYTGAIIDDESCAGNGGSGTCVVNISADSTWVVTGSSVVTTLNNEGTIMDADGNAVAVVNADGSVISEGTSPWVITVSAN